MEATIKKYSQYKDLKKRYPDAIILLRVNDSYETYAEDAEKASKALGIEVAKFCTAETIVKTSFAFHKLDIYLPKLIRAGYRVAIADLITNK